jgi:hypothetical protein
MKTISAAVREKNNWSRILKKAIKNDKDHTYEGYDGYQAHYVDCYDIESGRRVRAAIIDEHGGAACENCHTVLMAPRDLGKWCRGGHV